MIPERRVSARIDAGTIRSQMSPAEPMRRAMRSTVVRSCLTSRLMVVLGMGVPSELRRSCNPLSRSIGLPTRSMLRPRSEIHLVILRL